LGKRKWQRTFEFYRNDTRLSNLRKYCHLYHEVDNLGDDVVKETYLKIPCKVASSLLQKFTEKPINKEDEAPESVKKFFLNLQDTLNWFYKNLSNIGAKFCMRTGANGLMILRDFTLIGGYDFAYLSKPLIYTEVLKKGAAKRLKGTLEFWFHATRENALYSNSEAYQLIVRTRLMHSYARLKIKDKLQIGIMKSGDNPLILGT
jgi:hypothetical protein